MSKPIFINCLAVFTFFLNLIGYYALIFGHFGLPKLGLAGVSYTLSFANWINFVAVSIYILLGKDTRQYRIFRSLFTVKFKRILALANIGWPIGLAIFLKVVIDGMNRIA